METEWQHYLRQCIDTIVSIAEGRPFQVFEQVVSRNSFTNIFFGLKRLELKDATKEPIVGYFWGCFFAAFLQWGFTQEERHSSRWDLGETPWVGPSRLGVRPDLCYRPVRWNSFPLFTVQRLVASVRTIYDIGKITWRSPFKHRRLQQMPSHPLRCARSNVTVPNPLQSYTRATSGQIVQLSRIVCTHCRHRFDAIESAQNGAELGESGRIFVAQQIVQFGGGAAPVERRFCRNLRANVVGTALLSGMVGRAQWDWIATAYRKCRIYFTAAGQHCPWTENRYIGCWYVVKLFDTVQCVIFLPFSTAQLLLSITSTLRPRYALECVSLSQLIQCGSNLAHLDSRAIAYTHQSIVNCFVLPWCNVSNAEQDFERRSLLLGEYIGCLGQDLIRLDHTLVNGQLDKVSGGDGWQSSFHFRWFSIALLSLQIIKITTTVLPYLRDILDYFKEQSTSVKSMLLTTYKVMCAGCIEIRMPNSRNILSNFVHFPQPIIFKAVTFFNLFGTTSTDVAICVLNFSLSVIRTLQMQLGSNYVKEMLGIFLDASTRWESFDLRFSYCPGVRSFLKRGIFSEFITDHSFMLCMCHSVSQSLGDCNSRDATYEVVSYMSSYSPYAMYCSLNSFFLFQGTNNSWTIKSHRHATANVVASGRATGSNGT